MVILASYKEFGNISSVSILQNNLRSIGVRVLLKVWYSSALNPSGSGLFSVGRFLVSTSVSLDVRGLLLFIYFDK